MGKSCPMNGGGDYQVWRAGGVSLVRFYAGNWAVLGVV